MSENRFGRRVPKVIPWPIAAMPVYTLGLLVPVPFVYAAVKRQTPHLWWVAAGYGLSWIGICALGGSSPKDGALSDLCGFLLITLAVVATAHAFILRKSSSPAVQTEPAPALAVTEDEPTMTSPARLQAALSSLKAHVMIRATSFPPACKQLLDETIREIEGVLSFVAGNGHADTELASIEAILTDYLPTSLNTYERLPRDYALSQRNPDGRTAAEELELQLRLLRNSVTDTARSIHRGDALRLQDQSAFLQSKFGKSELDLY
jgi:hypothetical protein